LAVRRVGLRFAPGLTVRFADREAGLGRVREWAEKGMVRVQVVFGPEGCGKTAWLLQSAELLRGLGFDVVYVDPLRRRFTAYTDLRGFVRRLAEAASEALNVAPLRLAALALEFGDYALRAGRRRVAVLVDDAFQAVGLDRAAMYVKALLNLIEYPPREYERIVAIATTSEGLSRREIGRHRWAGLWPMWNMPREGLRELYGQIPGEKPSFEEAWRLTGGNPKLLAELYQSSWNAEKIVRRLVEEKMLTKAFISRWRVWLEAAVEDPDALWEPETPEQLVEELVERNLIVYFLSERSPGSWIDAPPPERDLELGVGRHVAWQTPLHREAVRKALAELKA